MTRGKNANKAANREQAALQREVPLRNEIARLKTRLEKADQANIAQHASHINETRKMRTLIAANTSERLEEAEARITKLTEELESARAAFAAEVEGRRRIANAFIEHLGARGLSLSEAIETVSRTAFPEGKDLTIVPDEINKRHLRRLSERGQRELVKAKRQSTDRFLVEPE